MNLLLVHGAFGAESQLAKLKSQLDDSYRVHVIELRGHGKTPLGGSDFSIEGFAEHVREFILANAIQGTAIFGYSMGGYVALYLAAHSPELVASVVTLGTKLDWTPEVAVREVRRLDPAMIRKKVPAFGVQLSKRHRGVAGGWERVMEQTAELTSGLGERPLVDAELLSRIQQPVRLMVGDQDVIVSIDETVAAAKAIARGEHAIVPDTPHQFEQVSVSLVADLVRDFLSSK